MSASKGPVTVMVFRFGLNRYVRELLRVLLFLYLSFVLHPLLVLCYGQPALKLAIQAVKSAGVQLPSPFWSHSGRFLLKALIHAVKSAGVTSPSPFVSAKHGIEGAGSETAGAVLRQSEGDQARIQNLPHQVTQRRAPR